MPVSSCCASRVSVRREGGHDEAHRVQCAAAHAHLQPQALRRRLRGSSRWAACLLRAARRASCCSLRSALSAVRAGALRVRVQTMRSFKINERLEFPMLLDMRPYTKEGIAAHERADKLAKADGKDEDGGTPAAPGGPSAQP